MPELNLGTITIVDRETDGPWLMGNVLIPAIPKMSRKRVVQVIMETLIAAKRSKAGDGCFWYRGPTTDGIVVS
jgi:hypothetical protein